MTIKRRVVTYEPAFDDIENKLHEIDPRLFLIKIKSGQAVFTLYNPTSGLPRVDEVVYIGTKGDGRPDWEYGHSLPQIGEISMEPNGWGVVGVLYSDDDEVLLPRIVAAAVKLRSSVCEAA